MNYLEIIQSNWILLEKVLKEKNIFSIQAFMNLVFNDISELTSNCKIIKSEKDLIAFEEKFEEKIQSDIQKYNNFYKKYIKFNKEYMESKKECNLLYEKDIRIIINESFPPLENLYPEKEYPLLKYFMYTEYKKEIVDPFLLIPQKGINTLTRDDFLDEKKDVTGNIFLSYKQRRS